MEPMRAILAAKFWNEEVESARSLDALVYSVPDEPPALGLVRGSKLSRSQQLLLLQRFFRVPFTPSVEPPSASNRNCGGVVLDRVIVSAGGSNWWTTITGRVRAQQFWFLEKQRRQRRQEALRQIYEVEEEKWWHVGRRLLNSSLYAISMQSHFAIGSHTSLSASTEVDSLTSLLSNTSESERRGPHNPWHGRVTLRHKAPAHDWILESAYRGHFVDREARYWEVPHVTTLDLASVGPKRGGLRYRVGLHHSSGDPVECPKDDSSTLGEIPLGARPGIRAQGAFSLEKELQLWEKSNIKHKEKKPYNLLAARPHVTLSGIAGGLLCAQLHSGSQSPPRDTDRADSPAAVRSRASLFWGEAHGPISADLFYSAGVTAQFGQFERLLLDHTKAGVRLDIGSAASLQAFTRDSESNTRHTLSPRVNSGLPTLSLSFQQQLVGPVCARVDSRFTLDPKNLNTLPSNLQDVTYGVDCSLEKVGAAKIVVWYSPTRQEGMAELRILER
ncbi:unnamed protein product [Calypogeia fissa]